ncbi:amidohydrolase family protein [Rhodococcus hoagii]|nr:amidohydrolase family protein [Prescottella equi]
MTVCESAVGTELDRESEAAGVIAFREALGLSALIDVHTHFMPKNVMDKVWAYFDSAGPLTGRSGRSGTGRRRRRASRTCGSSASPGHLDALSAQARDGGVAQPVGGRFRGPHPRLPAHRHLLSGGVRCRVRRVGARRGCASVQVAHPGGRLRPERSAARPGVGTARGCGTPIVIHCGSGPAPGRYTGPDRIATLLARHPRLVLIVAHMGMPEYTEFLDLADRYPLVQLDTTMAFTDFTEAQIPFPRTEVPRLRDLGDRILFGSDFPNIPYSYLDALEALTRFDLGDDWLRAVVHDNAVRLFGID